uniref:phosphoinositide 3-kinase adapter protein 1-like n=1 Tax=Myxine glutinosa TaxID=7769 RepID=UPI00358F5572
MKHEPSLKVQEKDPENVYEDMKASLPTIRTSSRVKHSVNMQHSQRSGQEWLIWLQEQVKVGGNLSIDEAQLLFGEWKLNQQQRSTSFDLHQNEISDNICTYETMKHEPSLKVQEKDPENVYEDMMTSLPTIRTSSRVKNSVNMQHSQRSGQEWLIWLQEQVKVGDLSIDEAQLLFGEWKLNQQQRNTSFDLHQETLTRIRDSIARHHKEHNEDGTCKGYWCISGPEKNNLMDRVPHGTLSLQEDRKKKLTPAISEFDNLYSSASSSSNNIRETDTECNEIVCDLESAQQFHLPSHQSSLESTKLASSREATQPHDNEPETSSTSMDQSSLLQPISFISPKFTALWKLSSENCPALPIPKPRKSLKHPPSTKKL